MATKNTIELKFEAKDINVEEVIGKITKQFDKITTSSKSLMKPFNQRGVFTRGLKQLSADIEAGNKPAEELQTQFDALSDKLVPVNDKIKQMQEGLAAVKNAILQVQAADPENDKLGELTEQYGLQASAISALSKQYTKQQTQLKQVKKNLQDYTKEQKKSTEAAKDNGEQIKKQAANLYRLNAAMTIAKQTMKAIYGILTSTSDAYARNELSMKAYELTFGNLEDSAQGITNELNAMVDALEKFGYNRSDVQQMAVDFYALATAVGVSKNAAVNMTSDYLKMANRISVATGETLANVTQMISGAISTGRATGVLTGLALDLREESVKKLAVERGLIKAENEDLSQSEMYMLRQYALTDAILKNQNLLKNSGNEYLIQQTQINAQIQSLKENIGDLVQGPVTAVMGLLKGALEGVNAIITAINKTPVFKNVISIVGMIAVGLLSVFAAVTIIKSGLQKVSTILEDLYPKTTKWGMAMQGVASWSIRIIGILGSLALLIGSIISLQDNGVKNTTKQLEEQEEQTDDTTKSVKKLKNELMGFDEINLLSKDSESSLSLEDWKAKYDDLMKEFDTSAFDDLTNSIDQVTNSFKGWGFAIGAVSLAVQVLIPALKALGVIKTKNVATTTAQVAATNAETAATTKDSAAKTANTIQTKLNTTAQNGLNISKAMGLTLIGAAALVGAAIGTGITFAAMQNSAISTKSANGNYFPSASATIIGEKYPEVAIPLGNSPQYADMQETIANRTAEKLSEMNGFNGTVNVYIGNEQLRDFAVEAVNDDLRVNYGTNLGKLARS